MRQLKQILRRFKETRLVRRASSFIERCGDTIWLRRNRKNYSWGECWVRAGWWQ